MKITKTKNGEIQQIGCFFDLKGERTTKFEVRIVQSDLEWVTDEHGSVRVLRHLYSEADFEVLISSEGKPQLTLTCSSKGEVTKSSEIVSCEKTSPGRYTFEVETKIDLDKSLVAVHVL